MVFSNNRLVEIKPIKRYFRCPNCKSHFLERFDIESNLWFHTKEFENYVISSFWYTSWNQIAILNKTSTHKIYKIIENIDHKRLNEIWIEILNSLEEILIFSTPKKIYKETDFNLVLESKITNIPLVNPTEDQYELLNSLLTEPNCTIIKNNSFLNKFNEEKIEEMKKYGMGDNELYGKFLE